MGDADDARDPKRYTAAEIYFAIHTLRHLPLLVSNLECSQSNGTMVKYAIAVTRRYCRNDPKHGRFLVILNDFADNIDKHQDIADLANEIAEYASQDIEPPRPGNASVAPSLLVVVLITLISIVLLCLVPTDSDKKCCTKSQIASMCLEGTTILLCVVLAIFICVLGVRVKAAPLVTLFDHVVLSGIETSSRQASLRENPLKATSEDTTSTESAKEKRNAFFIDPESAVKQRKNIVALLSEATDDDATVTMKAKGFPTSVIKQAAITKHAIIIMTDKEGEVVLWSEGACANCGFSARDAEGNNINSLLFGEKTAEIYASMTEAAEKGFDISEKTLALAHLTLGSISVSSTVVPARDAESNALTGFVLIGSVRSDDIFRTQSQFHNYLVAELKHLGYREPMFKQIVEALRWNNIRDLSSSAKEWGNVRIRLLLSEVIKTKQKMVEFEIDPKMTDLPVIQCDSLAFSSILTRTLNLFPAKFRIRVEQRRCTNTIYHLILICQHDTQQLNTEQLSSIAESVNDLGGFVLDTPGTVRLSLPFLITEEAEQALGPDEEWNTKNTNHEPLIILLLEKNAVHRHNISSLVWNSGHSLRIVENVRKALQAVETSTDLGCAIVDIDIKEADKVVDALVAKGIYTIETSENPQSVKAGDALLRKPLELSEFRQELQKAADKGEEAKRAQEELKKRRELFGKVRNSPWVQGKLIGRGGFATVYEATSTLTGGKMAVKMIRLTGKFEDRIDELMNEIEILTKLDHPNIIHYFYCERTETTLNLFMALAEDGTVADLLKRCPRLPLNYIRSIIKQLLQAVNYLHESDIVHRDIKPGNMLISKGQLKLSDFGTATTNAREGIVGTLFYMAPEVVDGKKSGKESDIWSIGCVVCECFNIHRDGGLLGYSAPESFPDSVPMEAVDFIKQCMQENPADRATTGTLLLHDFIVHLEAEVANLADLPAEAMEKAPKPAKGSDDSSDDSGVVSWSFD